MKHLHNVLIVGASLVFLVGCSSSRTSVTVQDSTSISKGKELIDLKRAHDSGAVTDREYEYVRSKLLARPN